MIDISSASVSASFSVPTLAHGKIHPDDNRRPGPDQHTLFKLLGALITDRLVLPNLRNRSSARSVF